MCDVKMSKDSPQQKCEVNQPIGMIKQELHEVDVWIGQDNSEAGKTGTNCWIILIANACE